MVENTPEENDPDAGGLTVLIFSNDFDKLMAVMNMATAAVSMGLPCHLYFTYWGASFLRKKKMDNKGKLFMQKMYSWVLPKGADELPTSKMNFFGIGPKLMRLLMRQTKQPSMDDLWQILVDSGANIMMCTPTMDTMGIKKEELIDLPNLKFGGAATFLSYAAKSKITFVI